MAPADSAGDPIVEDVREFIDLAERIAMPQTERLHVLALSSDTWQALVAQPWQAASQLGEATRRRLAYILPLMRRSLANLTPPA